MVSQRTWQRMLAPVWRRIRLILSRGVERRSNPDKGVQRLQQIAKRMQEGFTQIGFDIGTTETAVVPLIIGDDERTFHFWNYLYEHGVYVNPVVSPAVPPNRALVRTSYMAIHEDRDLEQILEVPEKAGQAVGIL